MKTFKQFIKEDKAKEGEGDLLWHVSGRNRDEKKRFTPMSHFGSQQAAREAGQERESHSKSSTGNRSVYAVRVQHKKSFETDDIGDHSPHKLLSHLHKKGMFSSSEYNEHKKHITTNPTSKKEQNNNNAYLAKAINSKGYDSLHYTNDREDIGSISHIITKPEQVRVVKSRTGHSYGRHRLYLRDKPPDWAHRATPWAGFEDDEMFDEEYFKQFIREWEHQPVSARVIKADYQIPTFKQFINEEKDFDDIIGHAKSLGVHMKISKDSAGPTKKGHYWNLEHMKRTTGKPGTGSQSLQYAMKKADERNMPMYLQAGGDDWDSMHKLMDYYGKHGFKSEKEDSFEMWRKPGTKK